MGALFRKIAAAAVICAVCFGLASVAALGINAFLVRQLALDAQRVAVHSRSAAAVRAAMPALVHGTRFEDRWQLNGDYRSDRLNLYVIRAVNAPDRLAPFRGNCSAASRWSVIVCDAAFLETFLDGRGVFEGLHPSRVASARDAFVAWSVGHEIGHVLAGDEPAHFQPSALDAQIARASKGHRQELAADSFVIHQLGDDVERRLAVENLALDLANSEIRRTVGAGNLPSAAGLIFDYRNEAVVRYLDRGTHPEFFVRSARILEAAGQLPGNEALREMVKPLIRQLGREMQ